MDGGNREDEDLRGDPGLAVASSPSGHSQTHHDLSTPLNSYSQPYSHYDAQPLYAEPYDSYPSPNANENCRPLSPDSADDPRNAFYAVDNFHAVASNATVSAPGGSPDDFYRSYRNDLAKHNLAPSPILTHDPMASAASTSRRAPPARSNSHSNSNGTTTTSKVPTLPGTRAGTRIINRSASNPVDDRSATNEGPRLRSATGGAAPAGGRASVKDMKKKFESSGTGTQSPTEARRAPSRNAARGGSVRSVNGRSATGGGTQSYSSLRAAASDSSRSSAPGFTQRSRFVPEDQVSSNSQSFASRINRPKPTAAPNGYAAKSPSSLIKQASFPPAAREEPLLFGEIRQCNLDAERPGYGIENEPLQRDQDAAGLDSSVQRQRSPSGAAAEPASPTAWYREASSPRKKGRHNKDETSSRSQHSRSHSDLAGSRLPQLNTNSQLHSSSSSRLPISNKRLGTPSNPASPASSRSNSPAGTRRTIPSGRTSRQQSIPTARAKTPVTRSKTPTGASTPRKTPVQSSSNSRLATVISPPPKLSPPLRSSRPRQPVSQATTASSRLKAIDRSKSPQKPPFRPSVRPESRQDAPSTRRRKLSVGGPVDFAQRRETIKLKYSKSIRDTEARQAREAAADKRKKELEAAAKAKARAQARAEAQVAAAEAAAARAKEPTAKSSDSPREEEDQTESESQVIGDEDEAAESGAAPATVRVQPPVLTLDSPTLGLPGTFPNLGSPPFDQEEAPKSAVSETSVVTEFDHEAQTEPPVPEHSAQGPILQSPVPAIDSPTEGPASRQSSSAYQRATYRDPFEDLADEESIPIKISLEPSSRRPTPPTSSAWVTAADEPPIPGAFTEEYDAVSLSEVESHQAPEQQPELQAEPEIQVDLPVEDAEIESQNTDNDEYEPQPYVAQPYHTTTVTIISRDAGFGSPPYAEKEDTDYIQPQHEPQMDSLEEFYTGPRLKDNIASLRDSTFTASDAETSDGPSGSGEAQRTPDTSNSLNVPSMVTPANRSSQHSMWTDLSYSSRESRRLDYMDPSETGESRPHSVRDDDSSSRHRYYPEGTDDGEQHSGHTEFHHAADTDTRRLYFESYGPGLDRTPPVPRLPDHSPPLPPEGDSRPTSGYYDDRRPSSSVIRDDHESISFPVSRRDSEDYHDASSPQSLDSGTPAQTPLDLERKVSEDVDEQSGAAKKAKNRLRQRQLCIKELVDTEAVFVRDMNVVEEIYKGTAEACPKLDDKTVKLIFRNTNEIIAFHTTFLSELKEGVTSVYVPRGRRSPMLKEDTAISDANTIRSVASTAASMDPSTTPSSNATASLSGTTMNSDDADDAKDRQTVIGSAFIKNIEQMRLAHEGFLRTSDVANKRLIEIQQDPTVQVWLNECNEVARDLTAAWNLDSLLIKPMQRITKYPNLIAQLLQYTPEDHPDREGLIAARVTVENAILEINKTKKNFELVGQIVGRKRKESDVKAGFARAFGKRVDKLQVSGNRTPEDSEYLKLNEKFSDDYLRLQVVLRDVEFYTRQVTAYVQTFLDHLSAMELVMRLQPGPHPELEAKWVQFNVSMRDIKTVALDQHLFAIRKHVIEPFELVIRSYQNPLLAMKKRNKRRLDYERSMQLKKGGKKIDKQLSELVEHYEALNDTLKKELPQLSALTEKVGNICLGNMINIQAKWWFIWREKIRAVVGNAEVPEISDLVTTFQRDFKDMEEHVMSLGILNPTLKTRTSQSTMDDSLHRIKSRPSDLGTPRLREMSITSDQVPVLPTPDFAKPHNPPYPVSPPAANGAPPSSSGYFYRDYYTGVSSGSRGPASPTPSDFSTVPRPPITTRPSTGRSFDSAGMPRPSIDSLSTNALRRESNPTTSPQLSIGDGRRNSGLFQSALPLAEAPEVPQAAPSSRASSRERHITKGYNVLWLAASLFEFNIETTKHEAGYPYLTYTAGEIFDVIAEKGELWLAKNQDDPNDLVGWIWSKHFAKLADS